MMILVVLSVLVVIGLVLFLSDSLGIEVIGVFAVLVGVTGLLLCAATIPLNRMEYHDFTAQLDAMRYSAESSRAAGESLEGAAWRTKVAEVNARIASMQYWNGTAFDLWYPDEVNDLEPLK